MNTIQLKWARLDGATVHNPSEAARVSVYMGGAGDLRWVADFAVQHADLALSTATHLANVFKLAVDAPDNMRDGLKVRDGFALVDSMVWWRSDDGPVQVKLTKGGGHYANVRSHPEFYSIERPRAKVIYED